MLTPEERKESLIKTAQAKQRRMNRQLEREQQMRIAAMHPLQRALESFLDSPELKAGVISSTKAGWGGSHYSVELFPDETWRVQWENQIGNLYRSPGVIIALPQVSTDDMSEYVDSGAGDDDAFMSEAFYCDEDDIKQTLRDILSDTLKHVDG